MKPIAHITIIWCLSSFLVAITLRAQSSCQFEAISSLDGYLEVVVDQATYDDGTGPALFASGSRRDATGRPVEEIVKWDGNTVTSIYSRERLNPAGKLRLKVRQLGTIVGLFARITGPSGDLMVAYWGGTSWTPVTGPTYNIQDWEIFDDGSGPKIHVVGQDWRWGYKIVKWGTSGWELTGEGLVNRRASALLVMDDGNGPALYLGGNHSDSDGVRYLVGKWDGTSWSRVGDGIAGATASPIAWCHALAVYDDASGPALYAGGKFCLGDMNMLAKWDGAAWSGVGNANGVSGTQLASPLPTGPVVDFCVFDSGTGPELHAATRVSTYSAWTQMVRWNGTTLSTAGSAFYSLHHSMTVFDDGNGSALYTTGSFPGIGTNTCHGVARLSCRAGISLSVSQPGSAGAPIRVANSNLVPGHQYYNIFSFTPAPLGPGSGPFLGLSASTTDAMMFLAHQAMAPLGTQPTHFIAPSGYVVSDPIQAPPVTLEGICLDVTCGDLHALSPVVRFSIL